MSVLKVKITDRIFSVLLSFVVMAGVLDIPAYAEASELPDSFTVCVRDDEGPVDDARILYHIIVNGSTVYEGEAVTENGEAYVYEMQNYTDMINSQEDTVEFEYSVSKTGYDSVNDKTTVSSVNDNVVVLLALQTEVHMITVNSNEGGVVYLNDVQTKTLSAEVGDEVSVRVEPQKNSNILYQISSVTVDNIPMILDNRDSFTYKLTVGESGADEIKIDVEFVRIYTIEIRYDSAIGEVTPEPYYSVLDESDLSEVIGTVYVDEGDSFGFNAKPAPNYRVSEIIVDGESTFYEDNNNYAEVKDLDKNCNHTVKVIFSLNTYTVKAEQDVSQNGKVSIQNQSVDYGGSTEAAVVPNDGYYIKSISVNDFAVSAEEVDANGRFTISNITEDTTVAVEFEEVPEAAPNDYKWNADEAITVSDNNYVFSKTIPVTFSTEKDGIVITDKDGNRFGGEDSKTVTIDKACQIESIELYYKDSDYSPAAFHKVNLETAFSITFYEGPQLELEAEGLPEPYTCYNSDVNIYVKIDIPEGYPKISSMEYDIVSGGTLTQRVRLNADQITDCITVKASENDSKDVRVEVTITDEDNNTAAANEVISINADTPVVSSVAVNSDESGTNGYYTGGRTAVIVINDRADTFNKNVDMFVIERNGQELSKEEKERIISWKETGNQLVARISFAEEGDYSWSLSYTNLAGKYNEGLPESDPFTYDFTIDGTPPEGSIFTTKGDVWSEILDILTFGIWDQCPITVMAIGTDEVSGIQEISYYKQLYTEDYEKYVINQDPKSIENYLENLYNNGEFTVSSNGITVNPNEKCVVYARIVDYSGNYVYVGTDGLIADNLPTEIIDINKITDYSGKDGFYNGAVEFEVEVDETSDESTAFSGIKSIDYIVEKDGVQIAQGNCYTWSEAEGKLRKSWKGIVRLDPLENAELNSDNMVLKIITEDNAGKRGCKCYENSININTDELRVNLEYQDDSSKSLYEGYFTSREATIQIVNDRATSFDPVAATEAIHFTAVDKKGKSIEITNGTPLFTVNEWEALDGGTSHQTTIKFNYDGNYTWESFDYTNNAGNTLSLDDITVCDNSQAPFKFTIDKTAPTGTIAIDESTWDKLIEFLTFGLYKREEVSVSATGNDEISPVKIEYIKITDPERALTWEELDKQTFTEFENFKVSPNEFFIVYLKITDYAGNYSYISSDGYIVDGIPSKVDPVPDTPAAMRDDGIGIYNSDVNIKVKVTDPEPYSGIKTVEYWVEKDGETTQEGTLFQKPDSPDTPDYADKRTREIDESFIVGAEANNSCSVVAYVKTVDNAGNDAIDTIELDIDTVAPTISVSYDNNDSVSIGSNGRAYFNKPRKATVTITERSDHFDEIDALRGIEITAVDASGNTVNNAYKISNWKTVLGETPDSDTHTATIDFIADANYTFAISYTDKAQNASLPVESTGAVAPYKFTVDTTDPKGSVKAVSAEGRSEEWKDLVDSLRFGFWSRSNINISAECSDSTSPIASVEYYKADSKNSADFSNALTENELNSVNEWKPFREFDVKPNEQFVVYLKITDMAGNITYVSTDGLIADNTAPKIESAAPEITLTSQQTKSGIYSGDVTISVTVDDPLSGGTYSGLKEISYRILNMGDETQSGELYIFDNDSPRQSDLLKAWTGEIVVDSAKNNSNDVVVEVYAQDNALNSSRESVFIKIDTTSPTMLISYDNNSAVGSYFNADRVATIEITERNFDEDEVKARITSSSGTVPIVSAWSQSGGTGNGDDTKWTAEIVYSSDGDYTFDIDFTDLAGNVCSEVIYAPATVAATEFTIDKTAPVIDVSYDNNNAKNNNYYKADRTATIKIYEHNFRASAVKINTSAYNDGVNVSKPAVSDWSVSGDVHTATVEFSSDAMYTFDIEYTDEAGNEAADFAEQTFYVDKTAPELSITGVSDGSANSGAVIPDISCSDTNFDSEGLAITLKGANRGNVELNGKYTNIRNGRRFTFNNFEKIKEVDDIYTLTVSLTDKAGNYASKTVQFSVNRFGSTYYLSSETDRLNGTFAKSTGDVVITEINANKVRDVVITLFKNNVTATLEEGKNYRIDEEGGNGKWYKYTYTIFKENFKDDGIYRISVHSVDEAENVSENTLDTKKKEISFGIDNTPPTIMVANLESGKTYAQENLNVIMSADDNLRLEKVAVYLDGKEEKSWSVEDAKDSIADGELTFEISGDSTEAHSLRIVCLDAAGNETEENIVNFFVTTNLFVRYFNNKLLFFGSICGVLLIAGMIVFIISVKRKRNKE